MLTNQYKFAKLSDGYINQFDLFSALQLSSCYLLRLHKGSNVFVLLNLLGNKNLHIILLIQNEKSAPKGKTPSSGDVWVLLITDTKPTDTDLYVCEVNSNPPIKTFHALKGMIWYYLKVW